MLPIRTFNDQNWLPSVFNDFFTNDWMPRANATAPSVNVSEDDKKYTVEVAAPGMDKQDFNVQVNSDDELVIKMEKKTNDEQKDKDNKKYLRREFSYTHFEQSFSLADNIDKAHITADVNNGVLTIQLPKLDEQARAKECRNILIN
jgi:HSP20 family protein